MNAGWKWMQGIAVAALVGLPVAAMAETAR